MAALASMRSSPPWSREVWLVVGEAAAMLRPTVIIVECPQCNYSEYDMQTIMSMGEHTIIMWRLTVLHAF